MKPSEERSLYSKLLPMDNLAKKMHIVNVVHKQNTKSNLCVIIMVEILKLS